MIAGSKEKTRESRPRHLTNLILRQSTGPWIMLSALQTAGATGYYNFLSGVMIVLFVVALVIIFVYEYEVLRRPKNQSS